jgi:hypothetical protein
LRAAILVLALTLGHTCSLFAEPTASSQTDVRNSAVILIKNSLIAVNQGNLTGNYTVLRDLSSPGFRERNSNADLVTNFENLRRQKIDLSPIVILDPVIYKPKLTEDGMLVLRGYFASQPLRINFELAFLKSATGGWMIHGVSIGTEINEVLEASKESTTTAKDVPIRQSTTVSETPKPAGAASQTVPMRRVKP